MREAAQSFILSVKKSLNLPSFELQVPQPLRVGGARGIKQRSFVSVYQITGKQSWTVWEFEANGMAVAGILSSFSLSIAVLILAVHVHIIYWLNYSVTLV
ncbi:hypothetical protein D5086_030436 [Populus alba]|uniref:Uncharacterized protein n=1 Tax=Populus alba TaxID=43335 RepID=A0ACC4ANP5_POPAL